MDDFIKDNVILILALAGAILSFLAVLTQRVAQRNKLKISIILAAFMFLIVSGQQIIGHIEQKNKDLQNAAFKENQKLMERTRLEIVKDIQKNVLKTKSLLEKLSDKLLGKSPDKIGVKVIQEAETNRILLIPKRSIDWWPNYVEWLKRYRGQQKISPCLSLTVNAEQEQNYNLNLLLLYLYTNPKTSFFIQNLSRSEKFEFPSKEFFKEFQIPEPEVKYILFFDGENNILVGYAHAGLFSKELLVYLETGEQRTIENVLNKRSVDFMMNLQKYFSSFSRNVLREKDAYMVAKEMISKKYNETAVIYENKLYVASLTNIVDLATR